MADIEHGTMSAVEWTVQGLQDEIARRDEQIDALETLAADGWRWSAVWKATAKRFRQQAHGLAVETGRAETRSAQAAEMAQELHDLRVTRDKHLDVIRRQRKMIEDLEAQLEAAKHDLQQARDQRRFEWQPAAPPVFEIKTVETPFRYMQGDVNPLLREGWAILDLTVEGGQAYVTLTRQIPDDLGGGFGGDDGGDPDDPRHDPSGDNADYQEWDDDYYGDDDETEELPGASTVAILTADEIARMHDEAEREALEIDLSPGERESEPGIIYHVSGSQYPDVENFRKAFWGSDEDWLTYQRERAAQNMRETYEAACAQLGIEPVEEVIGQAVKNVQQIIERVHEDYA